MWRVARARVSLHLHLFGMRVFVVGVLVELLSERPCCSVKTSPSSPSSRYGFYQAVTFEATMGLPGTDDRAGWVLSNKVFVHRCIGR